MEWYVAGAAIVAALVLLVTLGLPIPFAMIGASLPFLWQMQSFGSSVATFGSQHLSPPSRCRFGCPPDASGDHRGRSLVAYCPPACMDVTRIRNTTGP